MASFHQKWSESKLLSPETVQVASRIVTKRLKTKDLGKLESFWKISKLVANLGPSLPSRNENLAIALENVYNPAIKLSMDKYFVEPCWKILYVGYYTNKYSFFLRIFFVFVNKHKHNVSFTLSYIPNCIRVYSVIPFSKTGTTEKPVNWVGMQINWLMSVRY